MHLEGVRPILALLLVCFQTSSIKGESLADCDFNRGRNSEFNYCNYNKTLGPGHHCFNWGFCFGKDAHWKGGPTVDGSGHSTGGYMFIDPSSMALYKTMNKSRMAWMMTPVFQPTEADGKCMTFNYNIKGLSSKALRILLYNTEKNVSHVVWQKLDSTLGSWRTGHVSFTSEFVYQLVFEAVPNPKNPASRGYIAVDNIKITDSACPGDCMFDSGTCTWRNDNKTDELDFEMGRGSTSIVTGPTNDHTSQVRDGITGGYIYLNSNFPRGPGDRAHLFSQTFNATAPNEPSCMTFWVSVYGPGIGTISIYLLDVQNGTITPAIWQLSNELFDNTLNIWNEARTTISYPRPFQVIIEAVVGESGTGDIGIDDLSFLDGPCPILPQIASVGNGECSFFGDSCQWTVSPIVQELNTRPMWSVVHGTDTLLQPDGHTVTTDSHRHDGYMRFWTANYMHSSLDASALVGPVIKKNDIDMCIAVWVYMYSSSRSELGIGSLSILQLGQDKNTTLWSLAGSQNSRWFYAQTTFRTTSTSDRIAFLGIKGRDILGNIAIDDIMIYPGKCATKPPKAQTHFADCSFELDTCSWTISDVQSDNDPKWSWLKPRKLNGPRLVRDHSFDIETDGFIFVEILNAPRQIETELRSPTFSGNASMCLTFYYAAYGVEDGASLRVLTRGGQEKEWWNVTRSLGDEASTRTTPKWQYGQVKITNPQQFMIIFKAKVRISAFALDDIKVSSGTTNCPSSSKTALNNNFRVSRRQGRKNKRISGTKAPIQPPIWPLSSSTTAAATTSTTPTAAKTSTTPSAATTSSTTAEITTAETKTTTVERNTTVEANITVASTPFANNSRTTTSSENFITDDHAEDSNKFVADHEIDPPYTKFSVIEKQPPVLSNLYSSLRKYLEEV